MKGQQAACSPQGRGRKPGTGGGKVIFGSYEEQGPRASLPPKTGQKSRPQSNRQGATPGWASVLKTKEVWLLRAPALLKRRRGG